MHTQQIFNGVPEKQSRMISKFAGFLKEVDSERGPLDERVVALANRYFHPLEGVAVKLNGKNVLLSVRRYEEGEGVGKLKVAALRKAGFDRDTADRLIGIWNNSHSRLEELKVVRHGQKLCLVITIHDHVYELC